MPGPKNRTRPTCRTRVPGNLAVPSRAGAKPSLFPVHFPICARPGEERYIADQGLAVSLFLALRLGRPLFLEGEAGVGKTSLAAAVAAALDADLIRLQCYEGLDISHAVYEWDYARQLLELRILDVAGELRREQAHRELYSDAFLIKRPLL